MKYFTQSLPNIANSLLWVLALFATYIFANACYNMLSGDYRATQMFDKFGGNGLRLGVGALEGLGAVMILIPQSMVSGGLLLVVAMIFVLLANIASLGIVVGPASLMLVLSLALVVGRLKFPAIN